jgi:serine/threonine-protein kinase HipA
MAPGSSLGGARPKANILDENGQPWIAKFPSKNDTIDKAAWEFLAYRH